MVPKVCREISEGFATTHCVTTQKIGVLIYMMGEGRNHSWQGFLRTIRTVDLLLMVSTFLDYLLCCLSQRVYASILEVFVLEGILGRILLENATNLVCCVLCFWTAMYPDGDNSLQFCCVIA